MKEAKIKKQRIKKQKQVLSASFKDDGKLEAGVDQAGRGPFWGPIMAGAVIWPRKQLWTEEHKKLSQQIQDSKSFHTEKQIKRRNQIADQIKKLAISWNVESVSAEDIDDKGMAWANNQVFQRAVQGLDIKPDRILIDGNIKIRQCSIQQQSIKGGDNLYLTIAAASILAKVERDRWVINQCDQDSLLDERYHLCNNKGYGADQHRKGLLQHGPSKHHRYSYIYDHTQNVPVQDYEKKIGDLNPTKKKIIKKLKKQGKGSQSDKKNK